MSPSSPSSIGLVAFDVGRERQVELADRHGIEVADPAAQAIGEAGALADMIALDLQPVV